MRPEFFPVEGNLSLCQCSPHAPDNRLQRRTVADAGPPEISKASDPVQLQLKRRKPYFPENLQHFLIIRVFPDKGQGQMQVLFWCIIPLDATSPHLFLYIRQ